MSDGEQPTDESFGQRVLARRNVLKVLGTGVGIGALSALTADTARALGFDQVVEIDILPGKGRNVVNCGSKGVTPVAVRSTDDFDATTVDPATLRFGKPLDVVSGGGASIAHPGGHTTGSPGKDPSGEPGDFLGHFHTEDTGFTADDTAGWLVGETTGGTKIVGIDSVDIVGNCPEEEAANAPEVGLGSASEQGTDDVPEPGDVQDPPVKPPEGFREGKEEFEEWKERAKDGEVPQPPRDKVDEEGGLSTSDGGSDASVAMGAASLSHQEVIDSGFEYDGWEDSELSATPPDSNIAVGPDKTVLAVNLRWGIYDKDTGNREFEVELDDWFDPVADADDNFVFDPKALYDHHSDRFVLIAVARNSGDQRGDWVVAVSDGSNPFGTWWLTRIPHGVDGEWVDYPGLGVDENGIYLTGNIFAFGGGFQESKLVTIDKTPLYNGNSFTYWWWNDVRTHSGSKAFTIQPTHDLPSTKSGGSQYLVSSTWNSGSTLTLYEVTNPTSNPRLFTYKVDVTQYSLPPNAEQPGSATLDTVDARLMNAVFENGSVWTAHSITYDWNSTDDAEAILKWYEIDVGNKSVAQQRGWGRPDGYYFFPTVASDGESTMIVYNESGPDTEVRIEVVGRTPPHTQNSLQDVEIVKFGEGDLSGGELRWGDYSGIVVDPSEGDSYWSFIQYATEGGGWETWVGEVFFEGDVILE